MEQLIRVDLPSNPSAVFGLVVQDGAVTRAAPIAKYTVGWTPERVRRYFEGRGAQVEVVESKERTMHVIICGSRWFNDAPVIHQYMDYLFERYGDELVIFSGGATGADTIAFEYARDGLGFPEERNRVFHADWENCSPQCPPVHQKRNQQGSLYCPTAGHRRNQQMLDALPRRASGDGQRIGGVAAFVNGPLEKSRGTKHMTEIAEAAGVPWRSIFAKEIKPDSSPLDRMLAQEDAKDLPRREALIEAATGAA